MSSLDEVLKAATANPKKAIFVSRSGVEEQRQLALWIASRLQQPQHGYIVILQDAHMKGADFMLAMDGALKSGARVLALISRDYLASQHCMKEATAALDDQGNSSGRLVLLNIDDCQPLGLLRYVDRIRFAPVWRAGDASEMERVLLKALQAPADLTGTYLVPAALDASQTVHTQVLMHDEDAFTGRDDDLARLRDTLWNGSIAALTRAGAKGLVDEAALAGMGGVGKTTLARAYAFRNRRDYHGIWWVRADATQTLIDDLIELGKRDIPGLDRWDDREAAAREALRLIATKRTNQPWLIVYDNAPGPGVVGPWRPERNAHVIVTSRNPNWDAAVPLDVFTPDAAVAFLCDTANRKQEKDKAEAAALAQQLGYLPLALAHAASKCRGARRITFADYARRLAEFWNDKPAERAAHGKYGRSVYATFTLALDDIVNGGPAGEPAPCPDAETVMGVLAHLAPEQVPDFLLKPLYGGGGATMSEATLDRALEELGQAGLVTWGEFEDGAPHLNVHRLVQDVMRARLTAAGRAPEVAALATRAVNSSHDDSDSLVGMARNLRWLPQAAAVLRHAPKDGAEAWHTLWTLNKIGDLRVQRGSLELAKQAYEGGRVIVDRLAKADPGNASWQRDLSVSHNRIGDVLRAQGNLPRRWRAYRASLAIDERLPRPTPAMPAGSATSPSRTTRSATCWSPRATCRRRSRATAPRSPSESVWPRPTPAMPAGSAILVSATNRSATCWWPRAICRGADVAIGPSSPSDDRLAKADPGNAGWQRDLSVSHNKIGDVLERRAICRRRSTRFSASLAIRDRLAKADPGNAGWQRDLSVSATSRIGDVLMAQGNLPAALESYQARSPSSTVWPRPTPAMPAGSATSPCRTTRSATCCCVRATCRRR